MRFDFRRFFNRPLEDIGGPIPFAEAIDLLHELVRETGSHYFADIAGFDFAGSQRDVAGILLAEAYINAHRDEKKSPEYIQFPKPWRAESSKPVVTDEELEELEQQLSRRSAFAQ